MEALLSGGIEMPVSHGSSDMPVWGPIFRGLDPDDRMTRIRLANILDYITSIQATKP